MGVFYYNIGVNDGNGGKTHWVDALVDTGASFTMMPESFLRNEVGINPMGDPQKFTLADGSHCWYPIGEVRVVINDRGLTNQVIFGPPGRYALGAITMQNFGLIADTTHHDLIPVHEINL